MRTKEIKLKACYMPYLDDLINDYTRYGFKLVDLHPARWYEFPNEYIAIMKFSNHKQEDEA